MCVEIRFISKMFLWFAEIFLLLTRSIVQLIIGTIKSASYEKAGGRAVALVQAAQAAHSGSA